VGTLGSWLARGRRLLRDRLARRGLALSAGALATVLAAGPAEAGAPAALANPTIQAALRFATGEPAAAVVSGPVGQLIREGLQTMVFNQLKLATVLVLAGGLLALGASFWAHRALADRPDAGGETKAGARSAALRQNAVKLKANPRAPAPEEKMTITGQVVGADGKAVARARLAVLGRAKSPQRAHPLESGPRILAQGRADAQGRFRLSAPRTSKETYWEVYLLAGAAGHGLVQARLDPDARMPEVKITLPQERIVRGRLVDLQGLPARKVKVHLIMVTGEISPKDGFWIDFRNPADRLAVWPGPATTDARGRFELRGLSANLRVTLLVNDERYARQRLDVKPAGKENAKEASFSLAPAFLIEGTVTLADSGKPVPNAGLRVMPGYDTYQFASREQMEARADARGKYRFSVPTGNYFWLAAYPPAGTPYLPVWKEFKRPKGDIRRNINLALPRGVLVRGKVVEQASGKAVTGAAVRFVPYRDNNPYYRDDVQPPWSGWQIWGVSGPKGEFEIPVLPGPGHLLITGPTHDFVRTEITSKKLHTKLGATNHRYYPDGLVALKLKPQSSPHEVTVKLRRGVTLKGQVVGLDGKPVASAVLASRAYLPYGITAQGATMRISRDGRFELPGGDPSGSVPVFILDPKKKQGAAVELSGKQAGKVATVKLRPCGQAMLRLVDKDGKPVPNMRVHVQLVLTPGGPGVDPINKPGPTADLCHMANLDNEGHGYDKLRSDTRGRLTLPTLIPGATFMLIGTRPNEGIFNLDKEFKAEAGKTLDLGHVVVPPVS
jgi:hypothetical protein